MKSIFFLLAIVSFMLPNTLSAQEADTQYAIVEYMKVKPGMVADYEACEAVWKRIQEARKKAGYITGWQLEAILYPSGTNAEYDYLTVTQVSSWGGIAKLASSWDETTWKELTKDLTAEELELADQAETYRDLVKREIWTVQDAVLAPADKHPQFAVENYMTIPATGWEAWMDMESNFYKPVHKKSVELGYRAGWLLTTLVIPRGQDLPYQASTVDLYNNWEDMAKNTDEVWAAVYPSGVSYEMVDQRTNALRTISKTEIRMLVDYID